MEDFSFKEFAPSKPTARFPLLAISKDPTKPLALLVKYAGESNAAFWSAATKQANANRAMLGNNSPAALRLRRELDIAVYAKHVVAGWENVTFSDGNPAPCEADKVEKFLLALVDARPDVYEDFRGFVSNPDNFREPVGSAEELGKA